MSLATKTRELFLCIVFDFNEAVNNTKPLILSTVTHSWVSCAFVVEIQNISHCCEQHESIKHLFNYTNQMHNIYSLHTFTVLLLLCIRLVHVYNMRQHGREYFRI